jgi:hypothetical protein
MGTIKDAPCTGCKICPLIASGDPSDSINFTTKVNCLKDEQVHPNKALTYEAIERMMSEMYAQGNYGQFGYGPRQHGLSERHPMEQSIPKNLLTSQRLEAEDRKLRESRELARIDHDAWALAQTVPSIGPIWNHFTQHCGADRTPTVASLAFQLIQQLMNLYSPEAAKAQVVRTRKELVDLCERVVKAWDTADDKMDMQEAIEELDSLLYDLDKREGLNG